ncbi:MAG: hypothetical protein ABIZ04_09735, partial [Opitutus sp.]
MTLRERLLAVLREPNYSPANESELLRQLGLNKKRRASLAHELRLLLSEGRAVRSPDNRIRVSRAAIPRAAKASNESRKLFTPTRRPATGVPTNTPSVPASRTPNRPHVSKPKTPT